jgi:hypothetical protein
MLAFSSLRGEEGSTSSLLNFYMPEEPSQDGGSFNYHLRFNTSCFWVQGNVTARKLYVLQVSTHQHSAVITKG